MSTLTVTSDPSPMAVVVRNAALAVVSQGASPLTVELGPGIYLATAIRPAAPDISELVLVSDKDCSIHLTGKKPSIVQRSIDKIWNVAPQLIKSKLPAPRQWSSAADQIEPTVSFKIRFVRLKDWTSWEPVSLPIVRSSYEQGHAIVEIAVTQKGLLFAQLATDFSCPLNVALPPAGLISVTRCSLVVTPNRKLLQAHMQFRDPDVDAAAQYFAQGCVEEAKTILDQPQEQATSHFLSGALKFFRSRTADPATGLLSRYVRLRAGDDTHEVVMTLHELADVVQEFPDGHIISAELSARGGKHKEALERLLRIKDGALPLFTEGFSLLVSRLRQYAQQRFEVGQIDDEGAQKASALLRHLYTWAPFVDLDCLTLTFPGLRPTQPSDSKPAAEEFEDGTWQLIIRNSVFAD
jgi:hypothetical protein